MKSNLRPFLADPKPDDYMLSPTGNQFAVLVDSTQSGGTFSILEFEQLDNVSTPLHVHHDVDDGFLVLKGRFEFESDGERFRPAPQGSCSCRAARPIAIRSSVTAGGS